MKTLNKTIGFIGVGNMGEAMINGLLKSGLCKPDQIWASDVRSDRLAALKGAYDILTTQDNTELFDKGDLIILAVKPQHMEEVLEELTHQLPQTLKRRKRIMSIVAGFTMAKIERWLYRNLDEDTKGRLPIIRAMPNTPALVRAGMCGMSGNRYARRSDLDEARWVLEAIGKVIAFAEAHLDAVTAVSGSGPAYVFYFIESLVEAGTGLGFSPAHALTLTLETIKGSVKLLEETGEAVTSLRKKVTSKGGTTEAALGVLNHYEVKGRLIEALHAASQRAKELSGSS